MNESESIQDFLQSDWFVVVGASKNREKYGNKVLRSYQQSELSVVPVNPSGGEIEGLAVAGSLKDAIAGNDRGSLPALSFITSPAVSEQVLQEAADLGIKRVWLQPGAESDRTAEIADKAGMNYIAGGPCILVQLRFRE